MYKEHAIETNRERKQKFWIFLLLGNTFAVLYILFKMLVSIPKFLAIR